MKILYATSIIYPSPLANRIQILNNSKEFENLLGENFILGAHDVKLDDNFHNKNVHNFYGSRFSPILGARYTHYIWKNQITHVYTREEMLFFFIFLYTFLILWKRPKFIYEVHWEYNHPNFIFNSIFKWIRKNTDLLVSISKKLIDDLVLIGIEKEKILFAPDGVNLEDFETNIDVNKIKNDNAIPLNKKIIIYVGTYKTLDLKKGTDELIKAFAQLSKKNPELYLLFVGAGETGKKELTDDLLNLKVSKSAFKIIPRVPHKEVANFLRISDLQIMNFPWSTHFAYYMSPMKLFEYMASGKPLISTDLPSVRDILSDENVIFCEPGNVEDLENKISNFFHDESEGRRKAQKAREEILKYTWNQRIKNILEKIKTI